MTAGGSPGGHAVGLGVLTATWAALVVLTFVTVAAAGVDAGNLNVAVAIAIAAVKAVVVALYFMHLRWDRPFHAFVFVGAVLFVALFIAITLMDTTQSKPDTIPGYAPRVADVG